jgi:hypothetical protein
MDMKDLSEFVSASKGVIDLLKTAYAALPKSAESRGLEEQIAKAESQLKTAEAQIAKALGYRLCRCTFPPQIMLWDATRRKNVCAKCNDTFPPDRNEPQRRPEGGLSRSRSGR